MKKSATTFLTLGLLTLAMSSLAAHPLSGNCGKQVVWQIDTISHTLTISGKGEMHNIRYNSYHLPWDIYKCEICSLVITDGVTSLGDYAFRGMEALQFISISNTVTTIGVGCFSKCISLQSVYIPNSVTSIKFRAFSECTGLSSVIMSEN